MKGKSLLTLELSGSAYERGYKYGAECKHLIARMIEEFFYKEFEGKLTKDQMLRHAKKYAPFIEGYSPEIAEELRGMAEGSGRPYEEIVMVNAHEEREGFETKECTAFAATGNATKDGETYHGQNWDGLASEWWDGEMGLLFNVKRKEGPDILDYTNPGILGSAGLNSKGIGISWTSVPRLEMKIGVPTYIIVAEILKQRTIGEALNAILRADRAGCFHFIITDETEIYSIEATPRDVDIDYSDNCVAHANHFISEKFYAKQNMAQMRSNTFVRYNRMNKLLKEKFGAIDLEACMSFLRDHVNHPWSICRHPGEDPNEKLKGLTLDSWVIAPAKREFWIAHGPPCEDEFKKYTF